jgi:hypothetical protein
MQMASFLQWSVGPHLAMGTALNVCWSAAIFPPDSVYIFTPEITVETYRYESHSERHKSTLFELLNADRSGLNALPLFHISWKESSLIVAH